MTVAVRSTAKARFKFTKLSSIDIARLYVIRKKITAHCLAQK